MGWCWGGRLRRSRGGLSLQAPARSSSRFQPPALGLCSLALQLGLSLVEGGCLQL